MTGLEFIIKHNKIEYSDIAKYLNINKQSLSYWVTGERQISKKYHEYFENKFKTSIEFLESQLDVDIKYKGVDVNEYLKYPYKYKDIKTSIQEYSNEELLAELSRRLK